MPKNILCCLHISGQAHVFFFTLQEYKLNTKDEALDPDLLRP